MAALSLLLLLSLVFLSHMLVSSSSDEKYTATYVNVTNSPIWGRTADDWFGLSTAALDNYFAGTYLYVCKFTHTFERIISHLGISSNTTEMTITCINSISLLGF